VPNKNGLKINNKLNVNIVPSNFYPLLEENIIVDSVVISSVPLALISFSMANI